MGDTKVRKNVTLDDQDQARIKQLTSETLCMRAFTDMFGTDVTKSEAAILHALVVAGLDHVAERAAAAGYAELAASEDEETRQFHQAMRLRARQADDS